MSEGERVTVTRDGSRLVVRIATGPRPWSFRLTAEDAALLERALAAARALDARRPTAERPT